MINKPRNWEDVRPLNERQKIPAGAYECVVKQAQVVNESWGSMLCILFDIDAGEYAGYYQDDFNANTREDKKWKGVLRQFIPKDDGSDRDEWTKAQFKGMVQAFEDSNRGFTWNWDERSLKGRVIGILFRNEEWAYNGKTGWTARPYKAISVDAVADGKYTIPKDKPLSGSAAAAAEPKPVEGSYTEDAFGDDGELPF